jgi:hypothetical protein
MVIDHLSCSKVALEMLSRYYMARVTGVNT